MKPLEQSLGTALHESIDVAPARLGAWRSIRAAAARRRRRRALVAVAGLACVIAAFAVGIITTLGSDSTNRPAPPAISVVPRSTIIALLVGTLDVPGAHVAVLSPDGIEGRTITSVQPNPSFSLAVPASGRAIYTVVNPGELCPPGSEVLGTTHIARFDANGGPPERIAQGLSPHVTLDGQRLAFFESRCDGVSRLTVRDLRTGATTSPRRNLFPIAWTTDGSRLVVTTLSGGGRHPRALIVDPDHWAADPIEIDVPGTFVNAAPMPNGKLLVEYSKGTDLQKFVSINEDGRIDRHLFTAPALVSGAIGPGTFTLAVDARGRVLVSDESLKLQLWEPGDAAPVTLVEQGASAAAFLPIRPNEWP